VTATNRQTKKPWTMLFAVALLDVLVLFAVGYFVASIVAPYTPYKDILPDDRSPVMPMVLFCYADVQARQGRRRIRWILPGLVLLAWSGLTVRPGNFYGVSLPLIVSASLLVNLPPSAKWLGEWIPGANLFGEDE
jgi:hypothetical protein